MLNTQIERREIIIPNQKLLNPIAIVYTNKALPTNAELLQNVSLADVEELTGEDSEASHGFASFQHYTDRHGCGLPKNLIAIPEPSAPYVVDASTVSTSSNRVRVSSLNLVGTFNDKIKTIRFNAGLVNNGNRDVCNVSVSIASGDTASSVLLSIAQALTVQTKSSVKPLLANNSFTKYRGVVADKAGLLALTTPTNWDFAYATSENDFFIYKEGKWLKTYIGTTTVPANNVIYFVQAQAGEKFNKEGFAIYCYDKNSNLINVIQNITTYNAGITTADLKVGGLNVDTANRCVAGVGDLSEDLIDSIFTRLSDISNPLIFWNTSLKTYKDKIIPYIRNRYNLTQNSQLQKDTAGIWTCPVFEAVSGADAMDDIYFDSIGEIRDGWENNAQIQLLRFSQFENANEHYDEFVGKPLYVRGIAGQGFGIINWLIEFGMGKMASLQDSFINSTEIFSVERAGGLQNISSATRFMKCSFANNAALPFFEQLKENKRSTNEYSTDIIADNSNKYPFNTFEYVQQDGTDGYIISDSRTLAKKESALRKTGVQHIKLQFGMEVNERLKPIITNASQSEKTQKSIENTIKTLILQWSNNQAENSITQEQSPILKNENLLESQQTITAIPVTKNGNNFYSVKGKIFITKELNGVDFAILTTNK